MSLLRYNYVLRSYDAQEEPTDTYIYSKIINIIANMNRLAENPHSK